MERESREEREREEERRGQLSLGDSLGEKWSIMKECPLSLWDAEFIPLSIPLAQQGS